MADILFRRHILFLPADKLITTGGMMAAQVILETFYYMIDDIDTGTTQLLPPILYSASRLNIDLRRVKSHFDYQRHEDKDAAYSPRHAKAPLLQILMQCVNKACQPPTYQRPLLSSLAPVPGNG